MEFFCCSLVVNYDYGLTVRAGFHFEGPVLDIFLDSWFIEFPSDKSFCIIDSICGVTGKLVLSSITNESFRLTEGNVGGCGSVALIISDYLNSITLPYSNTAVCGSEINANASSSCFLVSQLIIQEFVAFIGLFFSRKF